MTAHEPVAKPRVQRIKVAKSRVKHAHKIPDPTINRCPHIECDACAASRIHQPWEWTAYHPITKGINKH